MKKLFCLLTVFTLLLGVFSSLTTVASELGEIIFYNELGEVITSLDGCILVSADITFTPTEKNSAQVIVSHYTADGVLTAVESITDIPAVLGEENVYTTPAISVAGTDLLKVFCWENTDSLVPLTTVGTIERILLQDLPTATVSELDVSKVTDVNLLYGLNFKADPVTEAQRNFYGDWYADFEITLNKTATFNLDGTKDGYLAGQYDSWSPAWVSVPKMDITLQANTPLKIMETAAKSYGKPGLKYTYGEVYDRVKDFDCGVFFTEEYLLQNPDLEVTLELRMYHPEDESISYTIGETHIYKPAIPTVTKFIPKENMSYEMETGSSVTVTLGELFTENGYEIKEITVTGADLFSLNENWAASTVTFTKGGTYSVTVTDNYYCQPATATVTITELAPPQVAKFDTKFVNHEDYLYRIGNQNTVALGSIFTSLEGVTVGTVNVAVEPLENTPLVSATYSKNTDWTKSTLKFNGTGVVKLTISDEESRPYSIYLEIVDAKNVTTATSATANNVVLLNDISGTFNVSNGYAFYGNGFTVTCSGKGNPGLKLLTTGFINVSKGGILDNTRIICDIFPESYLYTSDASGYDYFKSAVLLTDDSTISNCYIYGARCNIFIGGGNATVKNTVTECGSFANIQIVRSSDEFTVTLEDVTTIQYMTTSSYDTSKNVMGLGIAVGDADTKSNPYIHLKGDLRQYNWVTGDHSSVSNSYAKSVLEVALKESAYQHTVNGKNTVNLGMAYITSYPANIIDERSNQAEFPYSLNKVSFLGATGRVYSVAAGSAVAADYRYNPETDGVIPYSCGGNGLYKPQIHPNATLGGQYIQNTAGCNQYCYMDSDTLKVMIPAGDSFDIDFTKIFDITH